jgi:hypothetical protein
MSDSQWVLAFHSVLRASQRELTFCLPFPSCLLYNQKCQHADFPVCHLLSRWFLTRFILRLWTWRVRISPNCQLTFKGLYCVIFQKIELLFLKTSEIIIVVLNEIYENMGLNIISEIQPGTPSVDIRTKKTKLRGLSPQANYTDRLSDRPLVKLVPTLADRGCRVVSAAISPQSLISVF